MDQNTDVMGLLTQLNDTLAVVLQKLDEHDKQLTQLDSVLYDGIIGPANDQLAQEEYDQALSDFKCKYAEKLDPYAGAVEAIDGVDIYKKAFDTYNEGGFEASPDEYVEALAESLSEQISKVKEAVNVEIKVEKGDEEATTIEVSKDEGTDAPVETKVEAGEADEKVIEDEDKGESLADFEKSLKEELDKEEGPLIKQ